MFLFNRSTEVIGILIAQNRQYEEIRSNPPPANVEPPSSGLSGDKLGGIGVFVAALVWVVKTGFGTLIDLKRKQAEQELRTKEREAELHLKEAEAKAREAGIEIQGKQDQAHVLMDLLKGNNEAIRVLLQTSVTASLSSNQIFFDEIKALNESMSKISQELAVQNVQSSSMVAMMSEVLLVCKTNQLNIIDIEKALGILQKEGTKAKDD